MPTGLLALLKAGEAGPVSPFEVEAGLFFWTWVVFIVLFLALKRFAWPAIVRATEDRERTIQQQLDEAAQANATAQAAVEEQRRLLGAAKDQAQSLLADAKTVAEEERAAAMDKTRQEQEALLDRARREIAAEREKALVELRREAVDLSLAAASKLIGQRLEADADRTLVLEYLGSLEKKH